jgi:DNA invertase Pin-like site-specific DNA recombinase
MTSPKIQKTHLERQAVIYIRQSSPLQVETNVESKRRQYQLVERGQALGWHETQCTIIDDDQAISGAQSYNRPGFQQVISMMALREVGIILGLEVARLARNCLDWYQLLEVAGVFDVLVADEDGVYDLRDFNDRFLLGMKGVFAEVELYQIRARLERARRNKAQRGELQIQLPIGLEWDEATNKPRLTVDESIRQAITQVFRLFRQLRTARGVLNYLYQAGAELPYQHQSRERGRILGWRRPHYEMIYAILTNPLYAGVYCFGKTEKQVDPIHQITHVRVLPRDAWAVFLPDNHPGYITLDEFEDNQRLLADNATRFPGHRGAAGSGPALLQGLVFCQHCGQRMRIRYRDGQPYYTCDKARQYYGEPFCNHANAQRVDAMVVELFLTVVNTGTLELTLEYDQKLQQERAQLDLGRQQKLQRLEYETNLARRRYEAVEPENRLVARTLETEWNQKLEALTAARQAVEAQRQSTGELMSTLAQMQHVVAHLRDYWFAEPFTTQDKKELLRCLIEQVSLENRGKIIRAQVHWFGGATSQLDVPKYLFSSPQIYHHIHELARTHTDYEIADMLNQEGIKSLKGHTWTVRRVMDFRLTNAIPSGFTTNANLRIPDTGYITCAEAAQQLGVSPRTIQNWYQWGVLPGKQDETGKPIWIEWNDDIMHRLNGGATPDPRMVSMRMLSRTLNKERRDVLVWAAAQGHTIYRLLRGKTLCFFVLPNTESDSHK